MHVSTCAQHVLAYIVVIKQSGVVVVINNKCIGVVVVDDVGGGIHFINCLLSDCFDCVCVYVLMLSSIYIGFKYSIFIIFVRK